MGRRREDSAFAFEETRVKAMVEQLFVEESKQLPTITDAYIRQLVQDLNAAEEYTEDTEYFQYLCESRPMCPYCGKVLKCEGQKLQCGRCFEVELKVEVKDVASVAWEMKCSNEKHKYSANYCVEHLGVNMISSS
eukprot:TRINITY_DN8734_c0_g1_i1.p2 TRINITY_DN8734_c0_g1~~TRINITY_DN8734_c0_g1_i1.p2  ORF type:complete len:135 (-),score=40.21 TRINITY_DN8734_c0_g1_i1:374-778(-)